MHTPSESERLGCHVPFPPRSDRIAVQLGIVQWTDIVTRSVHFPSLTFLSDGLIGGALPVGAFIYVFRYVRALRGTRDDTALTATSSHRSRKKTDLTLQVSVLSTRNCQLECGVREHASGRMATTRPDPTWREEKRREAGASESVHAALDHSQARFRSTPFRPIGLYGPHFFFPFYRACLVRLNWRRARVAFFLGIRRVAYERFSRPAAPSRSSYNKPPFFFQQRGYFTFFSLECSMWNECGGGIV